MSRKNRKKKEQNDVVVMDDPYVAEEGADEEEVAGSQEPVAGGEGGVGSGEQEADEEEIKNNGPGRPMGSANRDYKTITSHPTRCPICGGTEFGSIPNAKLGEVKFCGTMPNGQRYTRTTRIRRKCRTCGQHVILVERHFNPDDWV